MALSKPEYVQLSYVTLLHKGSSKSFCTFSPDNFYLSFLITYLLTYSMEQSSSWEANQFSASEEIACLL
jgi:hypothetical protein